MGDRGYPEPCKGICVLKSSIITKEECEKDSDNSSWTDAKCLSDDQYVQAKDKNECEAHVGTWLDAECRIKTVDETTCTDKGGTWESFQLYDLGLGDYMRIDAENHIYYCGTYNQILKNEALECDHKRIASYLEDIDYGLCNATTFCRSIQLGDNNVAACTSCEGEGLIKCNNNCVNISTDPNNCGGCGHDCRKDDSEVKNWMCKSGSCLPADPCGANQLKCYCSYDDTGNIIACNEEKNEDSDNLLCINKLAIDTCGAQSCQNRGFVCPIGQKCVKNINNYECQCADGLVKKDDTCLNPYDPKTCGVTIDSVNNDNSCKNNEICNGASCVCAQGYEKCDGIEGCVDILNNPNHCGNCDTNCGENAYCENGICLCNKGFSRCGIVDGLFSCGEKVESCRESSDVEHCGAEGLANDPMPDSPNFIGYKCDGVANCVKKDDSWQCGCDTFVCDNRCIDSTDDLFYCGSTNCDDGYHCFLEGRKTECSNGKCKCIGENLLFVGVQEVDGNISYTTNLDESNIVRFDCIDTKTDPLCCGGKNSCLDKQCLNGMACSDGRCIKNCATGFANCNGHCLKMSYFNVKETSNGHCECTSTHEGIKMCPINGNADYGCLAKKGDENNCGECGHKCDPTYTCIQGDNTCQCKGEEEECTYITGVYDGNESDVKRCMNFEELHMSNCTTCVTGWGNLDKDWSNGCESDLKENIHHCGTEENDCTLVCSPDDNGCTPNVINAGGVVCRNGKCGYSTCNHEDYMDCDKEKLDNQYYFLDEDNDTSILGCETNVKISNKHCGTCGFVCESGNCENGKCCHRNNKNIHSDLSTFECCTNNDLYQYNHNWWKGCYESSHYGCSESELKGDGILWWDCWSKVDSKR